jgi:hypothetical protein
LPRLLGVEQSVNQEETTVFINAAKEMGEMLVL